MIFLWFEHMMLGKIGSKLYLKISTSFVNNNGWKGNKKRPKYLLHVTINIHAQAFLNIGRYWNTMNSEKQVE